MNNIKKIIIIIFILIITIIITLVMLKNLNRQKGILQNEVLSEGEDLEEIEEIKMKPVDVDYKFYTVETCLQKYITFLSTDLEKTNENSENIGISTEEEKKKSLYDLLDKNYLEENNITINNIYDYVEETKKSELFEAIKINAIEKNNICLYSVLGKIKETDNKENYKYGYYIVTLDNVNKTFMIQPMQVKDYSENEKINLEKKQDIIKEIKENNNNKFKYLMLSDLEMAQKYFNKYKEQIVYYPEEAYNYMDEEYRNKRFGTIENFKKYIKENQEELNKIYFNKYLVNRNDGYTEYVCKDQYDNLYIFKETNVMDYTMTLDTYTLDNDVFIETYENSTDEKKIQMNVDKFIQMINRHDYITSYNCISEGFKNNYFNTQEKFENYIKNIFFNYNKFEFKNITKKGSNLYTCDLNITDLTGENTEIRTVTIIMQLNDNLDFKMSFSIE